MLGKRIDTIRNFLVFAVFLFAICGWSNGVRGTDPVSGQESSMKILIYYDTSLSQVNRDQVLEFELISEYFNALGNAQVDFVPFDHLLGKRSQHRIENGDCTTLLSKISSLKWDGVALFNLLDFDVEADVILIFSDGVGVMDDLILPESKDVFLIKSVENLGSAERLVEHRNYLDISEIGVAGVLYRLGVAKENVSVENVAQNMPDDRMAEFRLEGLVFDQIKPLENVTIQVKGEDRGVVSDKDGRFFLEASVGDILMIGYLGMKNQEYRVTGDQFVEFYLNIETNQLDEVVLKSKGEAPESKNTISTAYGEKSEDQIGYTVQEVEDEEFEGQANLSDATRGKIISYNYSQNDDLSQIQLRQVLTFGAGTKNPLIVVDNVPMGVNDSSSGTRTLGTWHIDPSNVEKITVLRGLAATNKYGSLARGGAILIFTKTGVGGKSETTDQANSAMVQGNIYNESVTSVKTAPEGDYLKELKRSKSLEEAYELYQAQRDAYTDDFQYFVDVSKYMIKWGNTDLSKRILLNTLELNPNSVEYLRFVGMLLQDRKDFSLAQKIYEHVLVLAPRESQSYRDLALILSENEQYQKSLDLYRKIKDRFYTSVDFEGLRKPLNSEMKKLILQHKNKLDTQGLESHYQTPMNYDVRVVVDYNNRDAEFDLQFVNPQKKFFTWSHRKFENSERIEQEKIQGYNTEEFFLIDAVPGKWQVNIESSKQETRDPLVLRYTVFRNYGTKAETSFSKTLILNSIEGKYLLSIIKI